MSAYDWGTVSLTASDDLAAYRVIAVDSSGLAAYADATGGDPIIGVSTRPAASGTATAVKLLGGGTFEVETSGAVTAGSTLYLDDDGKGASTGTIVLGVVIRASSGAGGIAMAAPVLAAS